MNIEQVLGQLKTSVVKDGDELNKLMAGTKTPGEAVSKLSSAFPGNQQEILSGFSKIPGSEGLAVGDASTSMDFLKGKSTAAIGGLKNKFSGTLEGANPKLQELLSAENIEKNKQSMLQILRDPETQKKFNLGLSKIKNFQGLNNLKDKLSSKVKTFSATAFQDPKFDKLKDMFAEKGIDLPLDDAATKAQMEIDKFNQAGGLQSVGDLGAEQMSGFTTAMGQAQSKFGDGRYLQDLGDKLGKYQMNPEMLESAGMLQKGLGDKFRSGALTGSSIFNNPNNWMGGTKPGSKAAFLGNPKAQETGFKSACNDFFGKMQKNGGISPTDPAKFKGAMLAVSTQLGPVGAKNWRQGTGNLNASLTAYADNLAKHGAYGVSVLGVKK